MLPREKMALGNHEQLSLSDLLAIIIGNGCKNASVFEIAETITNNYFYKNRFNASLQELLLIKGLGKAKALRILACMELLNRQQQKFKTTKIECASDAYQSIKKLISNNSKEQLFTINLDTGKNIISIKKISEGILDHVSIHPREVFKAAIVQNAHSLILVHNHPSDILTPSVKDVQITKEIYKASKLIDIHLIDHLIVNDHDYVSVFDYLSENTNKAYCDKII